VDPTAYAKDCGIGVQLTETDIKRIVKEAIADAEQSSSKFEYLAKIKSSIPYGEGKMIKDIFDAEWTEKGLP
jgi:hypothetical protein